MKTSNYQIEIKQPCSEDWNQMSPSEQGRFCANCSRHLSDFSTMSDSQLIRYLESKPEKTCGRFRNDQLNRTLVHAIETKTNLSLPKIIGSLLFLASSQQTHAQEKHPLPPLRTDIPFSRPDSAVFHFDESCLDTISCTVSCLVQGYFLAFISVYCPELNQRTFTDFRGNLKLILPENYEGKKLTIELKHRDYETKTYVLYREYFQRKQEMYLTPLNPYFYDANYSLGYIGVKQIQEPNKTKKRKN